MSKLPRQLAYRRVIAALRRAGFRVHRQRDSHIIMVRDQPYAQVIVPAHRGLATGTLGDILDGAGLTLDQFLKLL
ncbi:MAG: type II toxin-antitoxin system HicA family toxin [Phycisphaerales bacterium]|nr:type II toxin-antitoxin system HicA family toxin [Phycisphaerales bacterium]